MFDNWREAFVALKKRIEEVFSSVEGIKDELVKQRRAHEDEINNITFDNMPSIKKVLLQSDNSVAGLTLKVEKNAAEITSLTQFQTAATESIATIEQTATDQGAAIQQMTKWQDDTTKNISLIKAVSDTNKSNIALLTETDTELSQSIAKVNLKTAENQSQIESVAKVVTQNASSIAVVSQKADANSASIERLVEWQNEADGKYASSSLTQTVSDQGVQISDLQTWQNEADGKYASSSLTKTVNDQGVQISDLQTWQNEADGKYASAEIVQTVNDQGAQIALAVSRADEASEKATNGASIVAAINENNESSVKIKADKLNFQGVAEFVRPEQLDGSSDVEQTVIDGGNIRTNSINADRITTGGRGAVGTVLGNNLMFNANAVKYDNVSGRYIFFVDPALYNVFIGVNGGTDAQTLLLHAQGGAVMESFGGERMWLGEKTDGNQFVTKSEVLNMIEAALHNLELLPPTISIRGNQFTITNPNSIGDIVYRIGWKDTVTGKEWESEESVSAESSVVSFFETPENEGYAEVFARIEFGGVASEEISERVSIA